MGRLSRLGDLITGSQRTVAITACIAFLGIALLKYLIVVLLLSVGVPRQVLQAQDAIITGALAAALIWVLLAAVRVRQHQEEQQLKVVADLNHHLRNALEVILASEYLRESEKATAILDSVTRIDTTLRFLLPHLPTPDAPHRSNLQTESQRHDSNDTADRRAAPRQRTQQQVMVRFTRDGHFEFTGIARDVSTTGIFLYSDADIVAGMDVELLLSMPHEAGKVTMPIHGKVVRVEKRQPVDMSGIAVAFQQLEIAPAS